MTEGCVREDGGERGKNEEKEDDGGHDGKRRAVREDGWERKGRGATHRAPPASAT